MRRFLFLAVVVAGCGTQTVTVTRVETRTRTVTTPRPTSAPAPRRVEGVARGDLLPLHLLVPRGRKLNGAWHLSPNAVAVWFSGPPVRGSSQPSHVGFAIWRTAGVFRPWLRVYVLRDAWLNSLDVRSADVTGDGQADLLVFEDKDGSRSCGRWRLLSLTGRRVRTLWLESGCCDNMGATLRSGSLVVFRGVVKDPQEDHIHCCWIRWRRVATHWRGGHAIQQTTFVAKPR